MADERVRELTKAAQDGDGCGIREALSKESEKSHYELLGEIVRYSHEQRKQDSSLPTITAMNIGDANSSDQFLNVDGATIYKRAFGSSLGSNFARAIMGNVPDCITKKKQG